MSSSVRAPIIQVGAGRSGSTLLARALNRHPSIAFFGESDFLTQRLWSQVVDNSFWFNWARYVKQVPTSAYGSLPPLTCEERARYLDECGAKIATFIHDLFGGREKPVWGFKEIWNGSLSYQIPWRSYRVAFPEATWVHLVRHPVRFAVSSATWNRTEVTESALATAFADWVGMILKSRELRDTNRFVEFTYESLLDSPEKMLSKIFDAVGLDFVSSSLQEFDHSVLKSDRDALVRLITVDLENFVSAAPQLIELCDEFGYETRIQVAIPELSTNAGAPVDLRALP